MQILPMQDLHTLIAALTLMFLSEGVCVIRLGREGVKPGTPVIAALN